MSSPTSVNTDRWWSASECTSRRSACAASAAPRASIVDASRPSEKFGTDSSGKSTPRTLGRVKMYYDRRAPEYDDWWLGQGLYSDRHRPGWEEEIDELAAVIASLEPVRTLDVACGTGFLTRHLRGEVVGLDASERMLEAARAQALAATFVRGEGDAAERWEERQLRDGSRWQVYKRVFEGEDLAEELGGELLFQGSWFLVAR